MADMDFIQQLFDTVCARKTAQPSESYVARLFAQGKTKIAQKVGEEAVETVLASAGGDNRQIVAESADLLFHLAVLWSAHEITPDDVARELKRREGISGLDEKNSRKPKEPL